MEKYFLILERKRSGSLALLHIQAKFSASLC